MDHAGQVALVTGAGRRTGLGVEVARQLARHGFDVWLTARNGADAQARAAELHTERLNVEGTALDITDGASIAAFAARLEEDGRGLDVLVNNAATTGPYGERASTADLQDARRTLDVILFGTWALTRALLPALATRTGTRIVNVSSGAGSHGDPVFGLATGNAVAASYAVAKAALNALTVKLAVENPSMRVNAVCPGFTATFEGGAAMGARPVAEGAASVLWAALLPDDGPTGGFFRDGRPLDW